MPHGPQTSSIGRRPRSICLPQRLEKPAGKHGFVTIAKDKLVFEDGTPSAFGEPISRLMLCLERRGKTSSFKRTACRSLASISSAFTTDSSWVVPNIFGNRTALDTENLSLGMLEKLDWWIKCLEDEGIYVWLDLEDGRQFKFADGIDGFSEISKGKPTANLTGYNYVNMSIERAMQRFNEAYLDHRNTFNGLAYKDDPGIVALLLTNENDVTHHFGNALLPDKHVPQHDALYMAQAEAFAADFGLAKDKTWRSWEQGPSKLFLNDLEHHFDAE